jgi:hypothetical protein
MFSGSGTATVIDFLDDDTMGTATASAVASAESVKAYVDAQVIAQDLDFTTSTGNGSVDLNNEALVFAPGEGIDITHADQTITIAAEVATTGNIGVASFSSDNFDVTAGVVTIKASGVANAELDNNSLTIGNTSIELGATVASLSNVTAITLTQDPTNDLHVATKQYVDATAQGLDVKDSVRVGSAVNIDTTQANNGDTIDGIVVATGDRILLKDQTASSQNGIYVIGAAAGSLVRSEDVATDSSAAGIFTFIEEGTQADTGWVCTTNSSADIVGTNSLAFTQFSGGASIVAGNAITKTGDVIDVNVDDASIEITGDNLNIKNLGVSTARLANNAVTFSKLQNIASNSLLVRNANSSGVLEELALLDTQIIIGNGNGMTGASISGDITMSNTGEVTIQSDAIDGTMIADNAIDSEHYVDGSIDTIHIANNQITTEKLHTNAILADNIRAGDSAVNIATTSGDVTLDSNAGNIVIDGHTGVTLSASNSGNITLDAASGIWDFQEGSTSMLEVKTHPDANDIYITGKADGGQLYFNKEVAVDNEVKILQLSTDGDDTGYVGINFQSGGPTNLLDIKVDAGSDQGLSIQNASGNRTVLLSNEGTNYSRLQLSDVTSGNTTKVQLSSRPGVHNFFLNNNVGIGTSSPETLISASGITPYITLTNTINENTADGCKGKLLFKDHASTILSQIQGSHDGINDDTKGNLIFSVNDGTSLLEGLRIDSNRNAAMIGAFTSVGGLSGSLTTLSDGSSYLIAGSNVSITTGSSGQVTIASTASGGGSSATKIDITKKSYFVTSSVSSEVPFYTAGSDFSDANYDDNQIDIHINGVLQHTGTLAQIQSGNADYTIFDSSNIKFAFNLSQDDVVDATVIGPGADVALANESFLVFEESSGLSNEKILSVGSGLLVVTSSNSFIISAQKIKSTYAVTSSHLEGTSLNIENAQLSSSDFDINRSNIFVNGQLMTSGSLRDYTLEGNDEGINFNFSLEREDIITVLIT